jgi:hypothetical protein
VIVGNGIAAVIVATGIAAMAASVAATVVEIGVATKTGIRIGTATGIETAMTIAILEGRIPRTTPSLRSPRNSSPRRTTKDWSRKP